MYGAIRWSGETARWAVAAMVAAGISMTAGDVAAQERLAIDGHVGVALPTGDFSDRAGENAGLARTGFTVGADVTLPIHVVPGLAWTSRIEGVTFKVDEELISELVATLPGASIDLGHYWGWTLFTGARYTHPVLQGLDVHGVAQIGAGVFKAPGATITYMGDTAEMVTYWKPAKGFSLGVGATVKDRFVLEGRYFQLINTEIEGQFRVSGMTEDFTADQPVSWVQVTAGIRVW
jgi:hypothetical protein